MDGTKIEWTDASWNPLRAHYPELGGVTGWGCQHVSPGCQNCYAEKVNYRLGTGLSYDARGIAAASHYLDEKALTQPLRWKRGRRIFLSSMTDVFGEWVTDEQLDRLFAVMALTPQHTYQVLTKRADRMREYLASRSRIYAREEGRGLPIGPYLVTAPNESCWGCHDCEGAAGGEEECKKRCYCNRNYVDMPLPNVWFGVSVEDQQRADERIPALVATPAAVRFLSCEPLLGPVELPIDWPPKCDCETCSKTAVLCTASLPRIEGLDWVIVGGESGTGARPMDLAWARSLVEQCQAAGVACFVKQIGAKPVMASDPDYPRIRLRDRKGGDMAEFPVDLRVREFPAAVPR